MKAALARFLVWVRLVNGDGNVSLTNLSIVGTFVVYFLHPDAVTASTFTATLAHYGYKRWMTQPDEAPAAPSSDGVTAVLNRVALLEQQLAAYRTTQTIAGLKR